MPMIPTDGHGSRTGGALTGNPGRLGPASFGGVKGHAAAVIDDGLRRWRLPWGPAAVVAAIPG